MHTVWLFFNKKTLLDINVYVNCKPSKNVNKLIWDYMYVIIG